MGGGGEKLNSSPVGYPAIVKPVDMAGSRGIIKVNNDEELLNALESSKKISDSGKVIIEEYLDGPEVSVELVISNKKVYVIQVTDKITTGPPHFIEIGHSQPSILDYDAIKDIKNVAVKAAQSLEIDNCLGHVEIKLTSHGAKMIEMGARAGGDSIGEQLIFNSTGVNFQNIALNFALGNEIQIQEPAQSTPCCIKFIQCESGVLKSISGIENVKLPKNIIDLKITAKIGEKYSDPVDNSGRWGYVIAKANTLDEAKSICDNTLSKIIFENFDTNNPPDLITNHVEH